ncbi:unnamed protein product [Cylicocyclus nassatus]|uniref:Uncharacterized protein n=1 Tax=Cylicocyclus nassatus TaxID=53992 RepID=A0AA36H6P9_CYLNA|nr:unnamed protein product [Cylicocyclus nassatus]
MFESADGLFGTYITEKWLIDELSSLHNTKFSNARFKRIGENEGSFSRICLMESDSSGSLPRKIIIPTCLTYVENRKRRGWTQGDYTYVKYLLKQYHNTETLFYQYARDVPGVPHTFLSYALDKDDRGIICMEYFEGCNTLPVYEELGVEQMKSMTHFGNPVEDLLRLFCIGLSYKSRKEHTTVLLQYYLGTITSLLPEMKNVVTLEQLELWYEEIFPVAGLWTIVSLYASYEAAVSQLPEDHTRTKSVQEKIHGVASDILEKSINR